MALKVIDIGREPDWFPEIKFITDIIQRLKYHAGAGDAVIGQADHGVGYEVAVFPDFSPHTKHK